MTKKHYFGGFLYHPESQQILLQQDPSDPKSAWTLLESSNGKSFQWVVSKLLKFKLPAKAIRPIYDYSAKGKKHFIFYAEVKSLKNFPATKNGRFTWFTLKAISKLNLVDQAKQDIIVGRRVIESQIRKMMGERTIG